MWRAFSRSRSTENATEQAVQTKSDLIVQRENNVANRLHEFKETIRNLIKATLLSTGIALGLTNLSGCGEIARITGFCDYDLAKMDVRALNYIYIDGVSYNQNDSGVTSYYTVAHPEYDIRGGYIPNYGFLPSMFTIYKDTQNGEPVWRIGMYGDIKFRIVSSCSEGHFGRISIEPGVLKFKNLKDYIPINSPEGRIVTEFYEMVKAANGGGYVRYEEPISNTPLSDLLTYSIDVFAWNVVTNPLDMTRVSSIPLGPSLSQIPLYRKLSVSANITYKIHHPAPSPPNDTNIFDFRDIEVYQVRELRCCIIPPAIEQYSKEAFAIKIMYSRSAQELDSYVLNKNPNTKDSVTYISRHLSNYVQYGRMDHYPHILVTRINMYYRGR